MLTFHVSKMFWATKVRFKWTTLKILWLSWNWRFFFVSWDFWANFSFFFAFIEKIIIIFQKNLLGPTTLRMQVANNKPTTMWTFPPIVLFLVCTFYFSFSTGSNLKKKSSSLQRHQINQTAQKHSSNIVEHTKPHAYINSNPNKLSLSTPQTQTYFPYRRLKS